jgi:PPOX class probable F420-dependent enzyme
MRSERLDSTGIASVLALDIPAHLATIDSNGYPRITPIWFIWEAGAFWMSSVEGQPHLLNLLRDPRAAVSVDTETGVAVRGVRENRRVRAQGRAELGPDKDGQWTRRITLKYVPGADGEAAAAQRAAMPRVVITLRPERLIAQRTAPPATE